jgi:hypothetical protein
VLHKKLEPAAAVEGCRNVCSLRIDGAGTKLVDDFISALPAHNKCIPAAIHKHNPRANPLKPCFLPEFGFTDITLVVVDSLNTGSVGTLK